MTSAQRPHLVLQLLSVIVTASASAQDRPAGPTMLRDTAPLSAIVRQAIAAGVPGIQAMVQVGNRTWITAAGLASIETRRPMTVHDRVRLASITKMMTYGATMELVRRSRLQRSDRIAAYLDPHLLRGIPYAQDVTIEHLLEHTSGIHNFNGEDGADFFAALYAGPEWATQSWTAEELVAFARDPQHRPTGKPGERRSYSSTGYILLGALLERVTGSPYSRVMHETLFTPLGMTTAGVEGLDFGTDSIADSYAKPTSSDLRNPSPFGDRKPVRRDGIVNLSSGLPAYSAWAGAAGAVAASVTDLARFMAAVRENRIAVLRDQARVFADARPNTTFSWNGGSWGIQSSIIYEPARAITVIVLFNASNTGTDSYTVANQLRSEARASDNRSR